MANAQHSTTSAGTENKAQQLEQPERELVVQISPNYFDRVAYQGSRAQLEAEGVIPPNLEWPEGRTVARWESGKFWFALHRTRPEGMKGPMREWLNGDWWNLSWNLKNLPDHNAQTIFKKKAELAEELRSQTPAARREREALWGRYWKARDDVAFQAFKALVPGLIPPKRGRKAAPAG